MEGIAKMRRKTRNLGKKSGSYAAAWDAFSTARPGCQIGTPSGTLRVALLRRGVATIHGGQISDFYFRTPCIRTLVV